MLRPAPIAAWNIYQAAHLLNRAGFGGPPEQIKALCEMGRTAAIDHLLSPVRAITPDPAIADQRGAIRDILMSGKDKAERQMKVKEIRQQAQIDLRNLRVWWIQRMLEPEARATEKAVLFWHGHFATSVQKVKDVRMMWWQNETFRSHAFGNFGTLLKAISRDPAMMVWLDLQRSEKSAPNENFAREVMELFTLGIGHYSEDDIKESARAFTGYRVDRLSGTYHYAPWQHDEGKKTFMGKTGEFSGDDILAIILAQPACAEWICRELWTFYAYENPDPGLIQELAGVLRNHNYELQPLLTRMFSSEEFYSEKAIRSQIKSPVQLVVQTLRTLQCDPAGSIAMPQMIGVLGQNLFAPPNVKGWDGNRNWINTSTLTAREQFGDVLLRQKRYPRLEKSGKLPPPVDVERIIPEIAQQKPESLIAYLAFLLFQAPLDAKDEEKYRAFWLEQDSSGTARTSRDLVAQMMKSVTFQLV